MQINCQWDFLKLESIQMILFHWFSYLLWKDFLICWSKTSLPFSLALPKIDPWLKLASVQFSSAVGGLPLLFCRISVFGCLVNHILFFFLIARWLHFSILRADDWVLLPHSLFHKLSGVLSTSCAVVRVIVKGQSRHCTLKQGKATRINAKAHYV